MDKRFVKYAKNYLRTNIKTYYGRDGLWSSVKKGTKHKSQGDQPFKEQYVKKVNTKSSISKGQKIFFG